MKSIITLLLVITLFSCRKEVIEPNRVITVDHAHNSIGRIDGKNSCEICRCFEEWASQDNIIIISDSGYGFGVSAPPRCVSQLVQTIPDKFVIDLGAEY